MIDFEAERDKIIEKIDAYLVKNYYPKGYNEKQVSIFSLGSINLGEYNEKSDIDLTVLLDDGYIKKNRRGLRRALKSIQDEAKEEEVDTQIMFQGINEFSEDPTGAQPVGDEKGDWGRLLNKYKMFYMAQTGKTEYGASIIENKESDLMIDRIPPQEGYELWLTCKLDVAKGVFEEDKNKIAKAILRSMNGLKMIRGEKPLKTYEEMEIEGRFLLGNTDETRDHEILIQLAYQHKTKGTEPEINPGFQMIAEGNAILYNFFDYMDTTYLNELKNNNVNIDEIKIIDKYLDESSEKILNRIVEYMDEIREHPNGEEQLQTKSNFLKFFSDDIVRRMIKLPPEQRNQNIMEILNNLNEVYLRNEWENLENDSNVQIRYANTQTKIGNIFALNNEFDQAHEHFSNAIERYKENLTRLDRVEKNAYSHLLMRDAKISIDIGNNEKAKERFGAAVVYRPLDEELWRLMLQADEPNRNTLEQLLDWMKDPKNLFKNIASSVDLLRNRQLAEYSDILIGAWQNNIEEILSEDIAEFTERKEIRLEDYELAKEDIRETIENFEAPTVHELAVLKTKSKINETLDDFLGLQNELLNLVKEGHRPLFWKISKEYMNKKIGFIRQLNDLHFLDREIDKEGRKFIGELAPPPETPDEEIEKYVKRALQHGSFRTIKYILRTRTFDEPKLQEILEEIESRKAALNEQLPEGILIGD